MAAKGRVAMIAAVVAIGAICAGPLAAQQATTQQTRVYREGGSWVQEFSGTLPAAPNLSVRLAFGNVQVQGGANAAISYSFKMRANGDEAAARRKLEQARFTVNRTGDTAQRAFRRALSIPIPTRPRPSRANAEGSGTAFSTVSPAMKTRE